MPPQTGPERDAKPRSAPAPGLAGAARLRTRRLLASRTDADVRPWRLLGRGGDDVQHGRGRVDAHRPAVPDGSVRDKRDMHRSAIPFARAARRLQVDPAAV